MSTIHFTLADGASMDVEANEGESIMKAAVRNGVPGIEGECGGEMSCGTCHVLVHEPWKERLRRQSPDEEDLLSADDDATEDSRLSCQIPMKEGLDGIEVTVVHPA